MTYRHGVYTSETATSIQAAPAVDSALPFVIGTAPVEIGPVLVTTWASFCSKFGVSQSVDINGDEYSRGGTLTNFAYYWFVLAGRGDCIMQSLPSDHFAGDELDLVVGDETIVARYVADISAVSDSAKSAVRQALSGAKINISFDTDYDVTVVSASGTNYKATLSSASSVSAFTITVGSATVSFGIKDVSTGLDVSGAVFADGVTSIGVGVSAYGESVSGASVVTPAISNIHTIYERFGRVASVLAAPYINEVDGVASAMVSAVESIGGRFKGVALIDMPSGYNAELVSLDGLSAAKPTTSPFAILGWPYVGVGAYRFPASVAIAAALNSVDAQYGGVPYVSPSNKALPVTGSYTKTDGAESPVFLTRDDVNTYLGAHGISGFRNTASGWVMWGDNTAAFPGNADVKDYMIPVRRMFNFISNQFQIFCDARVDLPLNRRQLDGVVNSFSQYLAGLIGFGALNAASISLDSDLNTTAELLAGTVHFKILIAPPPAMVAIEGNLEYDVSGFEAALA